MTFLLLFPTVLSSLLLAAHFLRAANLPLVFLSLLLGPLLLLRRRWVPWLVQAALLLGALEWVRTLLVLVQERQEAGRNWTAAAVILGAVALFTAVSALLMETRPLRRYYRPGAGPGFPIVPAADGPAQDRSA